MDRPGERNPASDALVTGATEQICPACGERAAPDANYCEACGNDLATPNDGVDATVAPCTSCRAEGSNIDADGYCGICGHKQPAPGDRVEIVVANAGGISDKGRRHHRNEDAFALRTAADGWVVAVVCDGVGSTADPQAASQAAADAAAETLVGACDRAEDLEAATVAAVAAAQAAVERVPVPEGAKAPPSCTIVTGVVSSTTLVAGWLGDSRIYRIGPDHAAQVSVDDSWANEVRNVGNLTEDQIAADPRANSITRWLGIDAADVTPTTATVDLVPDSTVVLCSDGLWNYAPSEAELAALVRGATASTPVDVAAELVTFANDAGGHDNITAVVIPAIMSAPTAGITSNAEGAEP